MVEVVASDDGYEWKHPACWVASEAGFGSGGALGFEGGPGDEEIFVAAVASAAETVSADAADVGLTAIGVGHFAGVAIGFVGGGSVGQVEFAADSEKERG